MQHHELPAHGAVVVRFSADAVEDCRGQEHRAAPPAIELDGARRVAEAQVTSCGVVQRSSVLESC
ncbi:hypothetical protein [Methylobacillus arboreus]